VEQPDIISWFFENSNTINKHNRQSELALKKWWQTRNPFFCLFTTINGLNVVDCYLLADHHKIFNHQIPDKEYKMTIFNFAGVMAHQLICNVDLLLSLYSPTSQELRSLLSISITTPETTSTLTEGDKVVLSLRVLTDANQQEHHHIAYEKTTGSKGKKRTKTRPCSLCLTQEKKRRLVGFGCYTCGLILCCPNAANIKRDCFLQHVWSICCQTNRNTEAVWYGFFCWLLAPIGALVNDKQPIFPIFIFILSCITKLWLVY